MKIVAVTGGDHPLRRREFQQVMTTLNLDYEIWDYPDQSTKSDLNRHPQKDLKSDLTRVINQHPYQQIFTHNPRGEYGHLHHQIVSQLVTEVVAGIGQVSSKLNYFCLTPKGDRLAQLCRSHQRPIWLASNPVGKISRKEIKFKRRLLEIYRSQNAGWFKSIQLYISHGTYVSIF